MTTTYDAARLDPAQYDFKIPMRTVRYQRAVYEFMEVVRNDPAYLRDNPDLITDFCNLVDRDGSSFPLAAMMIPEFRESQSFDTTADTILNTVLRAVVHRRPLISAADSADALRRRVEELRTMSRNEYIASSLEGRATTARGQHGRAGGSPRYCCEDAFSGSES